MRNGRSGCDLSDNESDKEGSEAEEEAEGEAEGEEGARREVRWVVPTGFAIAPEPEKLDAKLVGSHVYMRWEKFGWQLGEPPAQPPHPAFLPWPPSF